MKLDILAIAAHADDIENAVAQQLQKKLQEEKKLVLLILPEAI